MDDIIKKHLRDIDKASDEDKISCMKEIVLRTSLAAYETKLRQVREIFDKRYSFTVGQLVKWKPYMKNRKKPAEGEPAIVMEVLSEPVFDSNPSQSGASTPYFREPLDISLGLIDDDDFDIYFFDSRRFEPC